MRSLLSKSAWLNAFVLLLLAWVALNLTGTAKGLSTFIAIVLVVIGSVLAWRFLRLLLRHSLWRLRNRLIVTYVFMGVIPIFLILTLAGIAAYFVAGQVAVYIVSSELERRITALKTPAELLSRAPSGDRARIIAEIMPFLHNRFPEAQVLATAPPPGWGDYSGLIIKDGRYFGLAHVANGSADVAILAPVTPEFLSSLVPHLGDVDLLLRSSDMVSDPDLVPSRRTNKLPPPYNRFDVQLTWADLATVGNWDAPGKTTNTLLVVKTRPSALLLAVFGRNFQVAQGVLLFFLAVAGLFLIVELVSLIIGISLTRTITRAVHNLHAGTKKVTSGDFSHRIEVRGRDQLAELGKSFNGMTEHLERLIVVEKEKERLQSELEIAKEVQRQLFPKAVPTLRTLELTGICQPARMVSGDYYDFLCLQNSTVALAIGDVAGKGISAALLMASIQSIMRTQLSAGIPAMAAATNGATQTRFSTSYIVSQLNKQLYANTSPEKYATFCFGLYDEENQTLTYTNAGHLPPILLRNDEAIPLEVTGTVVGAFPMSRYEEKTVPLLSGDLIVAYTDGVSEPENEYGEEFGIDRIVDLIARNRNLEANELITRVMDAVRNWNHGPELPDDMTLLLARRP